MRYDDSAPITDFVGIACAEDVDEHLYREIEPDQKRDLVERDAEFARIGRKEQR